MIKRDNLHIKYLNLALLIGKLKPTIPISRKNFSVHQKYKHPLAWVTPDTVTLIKKEMYILKNRQKTVYKNILTPNS